MSDPKDFVAGMDSNARKAPKRVVFVTRRTSAQVKVTDEEQIQTYPEVLFRAAVAIEVLAIALVFTLSVSQFLLVSPVIGYATSGVLIAWTFWFTRRQRRLGAERRAAAEAQVAAEAAQPRPA